VSDLIDEVILREGGYVNHPADRGGPTRWGITQALLTKWRGHEATEEDVFELTKEEARHIYEAWYVKPLARIQHHTALFELLFDIGVMSGPETAIKMLQREMNAFGVNPPLSVDGVLGPKTAAVIDNFPEPALRQALVVARILALTRIVERDPTQLDFLEGWITRTVTFLPGAIA
jgi:lysozyme family protein